MSSELPPPAYDFVSMIEPEIMSVKDRMLPWVKLPSQWILDGGLKDFRWKQAEGGKEIAALILLIVIAQHAPDGAARLPYSALSEKAGLSRAMVSAGLKILKSRDLIEYEDRSTYALYNYSLGQTWAKLPAKGLYRNGVCIPFQYFHLRSATELFALRLYLLLIAFRDNETNYATISYDKMCEYSGLSRKDIRSALSFLASLGLVHVDNLESLDQFTKNGGQVTFNRYRLAKLEPYRHAGTSGRAGLISDEKL